MVFGYEIVNAAGQTLCWRETVHMCTDAEGREGSVCVGPRVVEQIGWVVRQQRMPPEKSFSGGIFVCRPFRQWGISHLPKRKVSPCHIQSPYLSVNVPFLWSHLRNMINNLGARVFR